MFKNIFRLLVVLSKFFINFKQILDYLIFQFYYLFLEITNFTLLRKIAVNKFKILFCNLKTA